MKNLNLRAPCLLALISAALAGCVGVTEAQLKGKLPRIDAKRVTVDVSTIYGVSGTLTEDNVKWTGDQKSVGSSDLRVTSPLGSYRRKIEGAVIDATKGQQ